MTSNTVQQQVAVNIPTAISVSSTSTTTMMRKLTNNILSKTIQ